MKTDPSTRRTLVTIAALVAAMSTMAANARGDDPTPLPRFERVVIDDNLPGAYQVELVDLNGDGRLDIVALGGGTVAWYENPAWTKRVITGPDQAPGVISTAARDIDGDVKPEIAIAYDFEMNQPSRGKLLLAIQGDGPDDPWTLRPVGDFDSIHRVRWGDIDNDGLIDLIIAPIFGETAQPPTYDQEPARLIALRTTEKIARAADWRWEILPLARRPVIHAIELNMEPSPSGDREETTLLAANNLGVTSITHSARAFTSNGPGMIAQDLVPGFQGSAPARGSSEIHRGRLSPAGPDRPRPFLATIEPWHGREVVLWRYSDRSSSAELPPATNWRRTVIDDTLDDGHALWVADVDGDGIDEIFAGHRGKDHRVAGYKFNGESWDRSILDREIAAQDLRGGDVDGDGSTDLVSVGGATHNVVLYRNLREAVSKP